MFCENCGTQLPDGTFYCTECGAPTKREEVAVEEAVVTAEEPAVIAEEPAVTTPEPAVAEPEQPVVATNVYSQSPYAQNTYAQPNYYAQPQQPQGPITITEDDLPEEYKPLSPISYFGLQMLYSIPIVGLIFMIIFSISRGNIHRRNFTLSYWFPMIIAITIAIIAIVVMLLFMPATSGITRTVY